MFTLGRFTGVKGPGLILADSGHPADGRVDLRVHRARRADAGRDLARQRVGQGQRGHLFPHRRPGQGDHPGRQSLRGDQPARADDAALGARPARARRDARRNATSSTPTSSESSTRQTDAWGIKVANVEIKHVDLDETMIRAIAQQAEAERTRRAKVINAEGEKQAAQQAGGSSAAFWPQDRGDAAALSADARGNREREEPRRSCSRCRSISSEPLLNLAERMAQQR